MLPTPSTSHIDSLPVYPPSEDSYLLLDVLSSRAERSFLHARFPASSPSPLIVEVGTGSGVITAFLTAHAHHVFGHRHALTCAVDLNPFACRAATETVERAVRAPAHHAIDGYQAGPAVFLDAVQADLTTAFRAKSVDVLLFNPPYVPSDAVPTLDALRNPTFTGLGSSRLDFDSESRLFSIAVDGGMDGMEVTWRLLDQLDTVLTGRGVAYVLLAARNKPREVMAKLEAKGLYEVTTAGSNGKTGGFEKLCVVRISGKG